jgi:hypothetical protein
LPETDPPYVAHPLEAPPTPLSSSTTDATFEFSKRVSLSTASRRSSSIKKFATSVSDCYGKYRDTMLATDDVEHEIVDIFLDRSRR